MNHPSEIKINHFQLAILLNDEQKRGYEFLLNEGTYCVHCQDKPQKGIEVNEIYLNKLNDILVRGTCNVCSGKVTRIMEFGEDKAFYRKANDFRKALGK